MAIAPTITSKDGNILINDANLHVGRIVTNTISSLPGSSVQAHLDVYYDGDQVGDSFLTLNGVRINSGDFTVGSNTITFNKTGIYKVDFRMTADSQAGSPIPAQLFKNGAVVPGCSVYFISSKVTCSSTAILDMNEGDVISISIFATNMPTPGICGIRIREIL